MPELCDDLSEVIDQLNVGKTHLVGHDWGSIVSWHFAAKQPDRVLSLTALSVGHPGAYLAGGIEQLLRSWYAFLFLPPGIAERCVSAGDFWLLRRIAKHAEAENWRRDLKRPGRLTAGLNWYRANLLGTPPPGPIQVPVLGIYSSRDFALSEKQMKLSGRFCKGTFRYERLEGIGHWMQLDAPKQLARLLLPHFANT
jgi:pimeloyl-ACP methyl ester carboxylesterase